MYQISNRERRDILRLLMELKKSIGSDRDVRKVNMARAAGLLIRSLGNRKEIHKPNN